MSKKNNNLNAGEIPSLDDNPEIIEFRKKLKFFNDKLISNKTRLAELAGSAGRGNHPLTIIDIDAIIEGEMPERKSSDNEERQKLWDENNETLLPGIVLLTEQVRKAVSEASQVICEEVRPEWYEMLKAQEAAIYKYYEITAAIVNYRQELVSSGVQFTLPMLAFSGFNIANWQGRIDAYEIQKTRVGLGN